MTCPVCGRTGVEIDWCELCGETMCGYCIDDCDCEDYGWDDGEDDDETDR